MTDVKCIFVVEASFEFYRVIPLSLNPDNNKSKGFTHTIIEVLKHIK